MITGVFLVSFLSIGFQIIILAALLRLRRTLLDDAQNRTTYSKISLSPCQINYLKTYMSEAVYNHGRVITNRFLNGKCFRLGNRWGGDFTQGYGFPGLFGIEEFLQKGVIKGVA